jgi:hypothetical protein
VLALIAALIVAGGVVWGAQALVREARASRSDRAQGRALRILALFAPAVDAAAADPRALLTWQPLAAAARKMFPEEFTALDRACGAPFPFSRERLQAAHARWTAEWLAWEGSHDGEYKLKAATAEADLQISGGSPLARARLDAIEREKLERYQRRYEEYVRIAKALQALIE